jgi:serine/threonine protein phosphatase PrpC
VRVNNEGLPHNEDLWRVFRPKKLANGRIAYAVFVGDGMGGYEAGEVSVACACDTIEKLWDGLDTSALPLNWPVDWGIAALRAANEAIIDLKDAGRCKITSGSTGMLSIYVGALVFTFHVGDSPAILVERGSLQQITVDHTELALATQEGMKFDQEPWAHSLVFWLGDNTFWHERYDRNKVFVRSGQIVVTCTDGLITEVGWAMLTAILTRRGFLTKARDLFDKMIMAIGSTRVAEFFGSRELLDRIRTELLAAYLASKAEDNMTFVLARYTSQD